MTLPQQTASPEVPGLLPPAPWRLHPDFERGQRRRAWLFVALCLAAGAYAQVFLRELFAVWHDEAVQAAADVRVPAHWDGFQNQLGWAEHYTFTTEGRVWYEQRDGRQQTRQLALETLRPFPTPDTLTVSYVAKDPERWVASWSVEQAGNRRIGALLALALLGGIAVVGLWRALAEAQLLWLARAVARDGTVRLAGLQGHSASYVKGRLVARRYRVAVRGDDGAARVVHATIPAGLGMPLTLPGKRTVVLTPRGQQARALVLRHDLWPLRLAEADVGRTVAILQQIDPDAGWRVAAEKRGARVTCRIRHGKP